MFPMFDLLRMTVNPVKICTARTRLFCCFIFMYTSLSFRSFAGAGVGVTVGGAVSSSAAPAAAEAPKAEAPAATAAPAAEVG